MKNRLSILALSFFTFRASYIGLTSHLLITEAKQNMWISFLLSGVISIPIVLFFYFLARNNTTKNIIYKINSDYSKLNKCINYFLGTIFFLLCIINFYNLTDLVSMQYLYKTPKLFISLIIILPIYFLSKSKDNSYKISVLILFYICMILYLISIIGLLPKVNILNIFPIETNAISSAKYPVYFNTLPLFMVLVLCNNEIDKNYIYGFILGFFSLLFLIIIFISILGIDLIMLFKYPEFYILKLTFDGVINVRLQNILGIQFILDIIVFISLGLKYAYKSFNTNKHFIFLSILVTAVYFLNISYIKIYNFIINLLQYIMIILFLIILIIKKRENNSLKHN